MSPLHHKAVWLKMLMGIRRVTGSTRLQNLAVKSIIVFNSTPPQKFPATFEVYLIRLKSNALYHHPRECLRTLPFA
eukprot:1147787-Pelagomonas_calceolata.AAC.2